MGIVYEENKNEVFDLIFSAVSLIVMLPIVGLSAERSLVLYLSFDGTLNDLSDTGLKGKLNGKADFIDGKSGQALLFDGKSSVEIPHDKALNLTKAHAISFWLKWDGSGASWCPFIAKRSAGGLTVRVGGVIVCFYHSNLTLTKEISHESQT